MQADAIPDDLMAIVARLQTSNADNRAAAAKRDQAYSTLKEAAQEELRSERDAGVRREGRVKELQAELVGFQSKVAELSTNYSTKSAALEQEQRARAQVESDLTALRLSHAAGMEASLAAVKRAEQAQAAAEQQTSAREQQQALLLQQQAKLLQQQQQQQ